MLVPWRLCVPLSLVHQYWTKVNIWKSCWRKQPVMLYHPGRVALWTGIQPYSAQDWVTDSILILQPHLTVINTFENTHTPGIWADSPWWCANSLRTKSSVQGLVNDSEGYAQGATHHMRWAAFHLSSSPTPYFPLDVDSNKWENHRKSKTVVNWLEGGALPWYQQAPNGLNFTLFSNKLSEERTISIMGMPLSFINAIRQPASHVKVNSMLGLLPTLSSKVRQNSARFSTSSVSTITASNRWCNQTITCTIPSQRWAVSAYTSIYKFIPECSGTNERNAPWLFSQIIRAYIPYAGKDQSLREIRPILCTISHQKTSHRMMVTFYLLLS